MRRHAHSDLGPRETVVNAGPRVTVVHAMEYHFPAEWQFPPTEVPYSIVRMITAGSAVFAVDGEVFSVSAGTVVLVPEGAVLACQSSAPDLAFVSVRFATSMTVDGRDLLPEAFSLPVVHAAEAEGELRAHFDAVVDAWAQPSPARPLLAGGHLQIILGTLLARAHAGSARTRPPARRRRRVAGRAQDPRIERVMDEITRNEKAAPDVARLCVLAHMSESTLRRTFKEYTGKTMGEFHRELRMVAGARLLMLTEDSIADIAAKVGFPDPNYFTRVFRQVFGIAPLAYRREARQG